MYLPGDCAATADECRFAKVRIFSEGFPKRKTDSEQAMNHGCGSVSTSPGYFPCQMRTLSVTLRGRQDTLNLGEVVGFVPGLELYPAAKGVPDAGGGVRGPERLGVLASKLL